MYTSQKKKVPFLRKAIYNLWSAAESKKWKRDEDEVASAKVLLKEWTGKVGHRAEIIELKPEPGLIALAFVLPDLLEKWNDRIREVSMDSTCKSALNQAHVCPYTYHIPSHSQGTPMVLVSRYTLSLVRRTALASRSVTS